MAEAEAAPAEQSALKIIDWEEAMTQVGGDEEFLNEVLQDLLTGELVVRFTWAAGVDGWQFPRPPDGHPSRGRAHFETIIILHGYFIALTTALLLFPLKPHCPLRAESATAEQEIGDAIGTSDFSGVMKAAHRIKGSASYLCCEALRDISLKLQDACHEGTASPKDPEQLLATIKTLFEKFVQCLKDLKAEIEAREANK